MTLQHYHVLCPIQNHYDIYIYAILFTTYPIYYLLPNLPNLLLLLLLLL